MTLRDLGWGAHFADAFRPYHDQGLVPARVAVQHRGAYDLLSEAGELRAALAGRLVREQTFAAVGDWVAVAPREGTIHGVLPRRTAFSRKEAWVRPAEQIVAANVDTVLLVTALGRDLNPRRLERYLVAGWESGAAPAIVLTKTDLDPEGVPAALAEAEAVAFGVPVHPVSAVTGEGMEELGGYLGPGRTVALLGSSGVGKSTLVNRLFGRELLATAEVRADERGRHATTRRELVPVPGGGLLLDTPGMRELQLWEPEGGLDGGFPDVAALAERCRFSDCAHEREPGCAVRAALAGGSLAPERFAGYRKLERELRALALKLDKSLASEERRKRRKQARSRRKVRY